MEDLLTLVRELDGARYVDLIEDDETGFVILQVWFGGDQVQLIQLDGEVVSSYGLGEVGTDPRDAIIHIRECREGVINGTIG